MCVCACARPRSPAGFSGPALQNAHGDLQHYLPEEELHAALWPRSQELQPNAATQVNKPRCSVCKNEKLF